MKKKQEKSFLVILFGILDYDGRTQRMLRILKDLGNVIIVDLAADNKIRGNEWPGIERKSVYIKKNVNKVIKHLKFWNTAIFLATRRNPDVVVASDYFTILPGWISARICNSKFVYDAHELIIPELGSTVSKRDRFWYWLERCIVKKADLIIAANEDRARYMYEHYRLKMPPAVLRNIPSCFDDNNDIKSEEFHQINQIIKKKSDEVLLLYQGDVDLCRGIGRFIEAMKYLPEHYRLVIIGDGRDFSHIKKEAKIYGKEGRIVMLGRIPYKILHKVTKLADIGLISYPFTGLNNIYCAPNKIYEYARAGLPIVSTDQPPLRKMINNYKIGALISQNDSSQQVAKTIESVAILGKKFFKEALEKFLKENRWEDDANYIRGLLIRLINQNCLR